MDLQSHYVNKIVSAFQDFVLKYHMTHSIEGQVMLPIPLISVYRPAMQPSFFSGFNNNNHQPSNQPTKKLQQTKKPHLVSLLAGPPEW